MISLWNKDVRMSRGMGRREAGYINLDGLIKLLSELKDGPNRLTLQYLLLWRPLMDGELMRTGREGATELGFQFYVFWILEW